MPAVATSVRGPMKPANAPRPSPSGGPSLSGRSGNGAAADTGRRVAADLAGARANCQRTYPQACRRRRGWRSCQSCSPIGVTAARRWITGPRRLASAVERCDSGCSSRSRIAPGDLPTPAARVSSLWIDQTCVFRYQARRRALALQLLAHGTGTARSRSQSFSRRQPQRRSSGRCGSRSHPTPPALR